MDKLDFDDVVALAGAVGTLVRSGAMDLDRTLAMKLVQSTEHPLMDAAAATGSEAALGYLITTRCGLRTSRLVAGVLAVHGAACTHIQPVARHAGTMTAPARTQPAAWTRHHCISKHPGWLRFSTGWQRRSTGHPRGGCWQRWIWYLPQHRWGLPIVCNSPLHATAHRLLNSPSAA